MSSEEFSKIAEMPLLKDYLTASWDDLVGRFHYLTAERGREAEYVAILLTIKQARESNRINRQLVIATWIVALITALSLILISISNVTSHSKLQTFSVDESSLQKSRDRLIANGATPERIRMLEVEAEIEVLQEELAKLRKSP